MPLVVVRRSFAAVRLLCVVPSNFVGSGVSATDGCQPTCLFIRSSAEDICVSGVRSWQARIKKPGTSWRPRSQCQELGGTDRLDSSHERVERAESAVSVWEYFLGGTATFIVGGTATAARHNVELSSEAVGPWELGRKAAGFGCSMEAKSRDPRRGWRPEPVARCF